MASLSTTVTLRVLFGILLHKRMALDAAKWTNVEQATRAFSSRGVHLRGWLCKIQAHVMEDLLDLM